MFWKFSCQSEKVDGSLTAGGNPFVWGKRGSDKARGVAWLAQLEAGRARGHSERQRASPCVRGDRALGNIQTQGLPGGVMGGGHPLSHTRPPTPKEKQRLCVYL